MSRKELSVANVGERTGISVALGTGQPVTKSALSKVTRGA